MPQQEANFYWGFVLKLLNWVFGLHHRSERG